MAKANTTTALNQEGPLVATVNPVTGEVIITHAAPVPVYDLNTQPPGLLDGEIFGVPTKLIVVVGLAYLLLKGK